VTSLGLGALVVLLAAGGSGPSQVPCGAGASVHGTSADHWDRARNGAVVQFCDRLAMGLARLATDPAAALQTADEADALVPDQAGALVLRGRALVALSRAEEGKAALLRAGTLDPAALGEPLALWALARAQRASGSRQPGEAGASSEKSVGAEPASRTAAGPFRWPVVAPAESIATYRALVPTIGFLATGGQRAEALLEAGSVILDEGPVGAIDAAAVFDRLILSGEAGSRTRARAWLALALDRQGKTAEAAVVARAAVQDGALLIVHERDATAPSYEALLGVLSGPFTPSAGAAHLRAYAERAGPTAPWASHARERATTMSRQKPVVAASRSRNGGRP
jgi:hypothetical protein